MYSPIPGHHYEIIIVDDGSIDGTNKTMEVLKEYSPVPLKLFQQAQKGPAAARNIGIRNAEGEIVLIIGDDVISLPTLLEEHILWHKKYPSDNIAVLGFTTWSPQIEITPFMRWLENGGPQFKYWSIKDKENVGYVHFYTSNISFKRDFPLKNGVFDEDFPYASYEDTELGFRLEKKGLRIVYNDRAIGYHYHYTSLNDALNRMERVGLSRQIYLSKVGGDIQNADRNGRSPLREFLSAVKFNLFKLVGHVAERRFVAPKVYSYLMDMAMSEGFNKKLQI